MKSCIVVCIVMIYCGCSSTSEKNSSIDDIRERAEEAYEELDVEIDK
ncbi:MAG: hypothetical protein OCD01_18155 [Fibrobacterales bacterium]